jgi:hypothetical protein
VKALLNLTVDYMFMQTDPKLNNKK